LVVSGTTSRSGTTSSSPRQAPPPRSPGLLVVAVSINLEQILSFPVLPARAAAVPATLILALVVPTLALVPDQGRHILGAEFLIA
jgi:hypothetical protein